MKKIIFLIALVTAFAFANNVMYVADASADLGATEVELLLNLDNSDEAGGVQLDIYDGPDVLDYLSISTTDRTAGFTAAANAIADGGVRVLLFSMTGDIIAAGTGPIVAINFGINTSEAMEVQLTQQDATLSDPIGQALPLTTEVGTLTIGTVVDDYLSLTIGDGAGDAG
ncbi:hypothetical protein H8D59_02170, partial [bacterium]|nr:hypothetical protein [bacterium]